MAKYVGIQKIEQLNTIHYYLVSTPDFDGAHFFIGINPNKMTLEIYKNKPFDKALSILDLTKDNFAGLKIPEINMKVLPYVLLKARKAIKENEFLIFLDYVA